MEGGNIIFFLFLKIRPLCPKCGKRFESLGLLQSHIIKVHIERSEVSSAGPKDSDTVRVKKWIHDSGLITKSLGLPYYQPHYRPPPSPPTRSCIVCHREFKNRADFNRHFRGRADFNRHFREHKKLGEKGS